MTQRESLLKYQRKVVEWARCTAFKIVLILVSPKPKDRLKKREPWVRTHFQPLTKRKVMQTRSTVAVAKQFWFPLFIGHFHRQLIFLWNDSIYKMTLRTVFSQHKWWKSSKMWRKQGKNGDTSNMVHKLFPRHPLHHNLTDWAVSVVLLKYKDFFAFDSDGFPML